jgi:hypothetical protein
MSQKIEKPRLGGAFLYINYWRREPESNRPKRLCRPLHNRFAIAPQADWNLATDSQICLVGNRKDWPTKQKGKRCFPLCMERETRLELATSTLARLRSTN